MSYKLLSINAAKATLDISHRRLGAHSPPTTSSANNAKTDGGEGIDFNDTAMVSASDTGSSAA